MTRWEATNERGRATRAEDRAVSVPSERLVEALDAQIRLVHEMVGVARSIEQHVVAFEYRALATATDEQRLLTERLGATEQRSREAFEGARAALGLSQAAAPTLTELAPHLPEPARGQVDQRASTLRSLLQALRELHQISQVHAERGQRVVGSYARMLASRSKRREADTYDKRGRQSAGLNGASTLRRKA